MISFCVSHKKVIHTCLKWQDSHDTYHWLQEQSLQTLCVVQTMTPQPWLLSVQIPTQLLWLGLSAEPCDSHNKTRIVTLPLGIQRNEHKLLNHGKIRLHCSDGEDQLWIGSSNSYSNWKDFGCFWLHPIVRLPCHETTSKAKSVWRIFILHPYFGIFWKMHQVYHSHLPITHNQNWQKINLHWACPISLWNARKKCQTFSKMKECCK